MSGVSYFQRYSQSENHATNNTLLLLRYVAERGPQRLRRVLSSLTDVDLSVGVKFEQQISGHGSVLDALISQDAFEIAVEAKLGDALWHDQFGDISRTCPNAGHWACAFSSNSPDP